MQEILLVPHRDGCSPLLVYFSSFSGIYPEEGRNHGSGPQPGGGEDETRQPTDTVGAGH